MSSAALSRNLPFLNPDGVRATGSIQGERFRFVSGSMGARFFPVNYGNCLFVTVNEEGFRLAVLFVFRFLSPPLFIPWAGIESVLEKRFLFMRYAAIRIRDNWPTIAFHGKAGKGILEAYAKASGKRVPVGTVGGRNG